MRGRRRPSPPARVSGRRAVLCCSMSLFSISLASAGNLCWAKPNHGFCGCQQSVANNSRSPGPRFSRWRTGRNTRHRPRLAANRGALAGRMQKISCFMLYSRNGCLQRCKPSRVRSHRLPDDREVFPGASSSEKYFSAWRRFRVHPPRFARKIRQRRPRPHGRARKKKPASLPARVPVSRSSRMSREQVHAISVLVVLEQFGVVIGAE